MTPQQKKLVQALLDYIKVFNDGCDCCATMQACETEEYKAVQRAIMEDETT